MLTNSWRRETRLVLGVLTVLVSVSGLAQAQQSGLFPNHPIRRQRVPCPNEDPVYKLYRSQYFGYHPTVWRQFPDGWGAPSPYAPNPKLEFEKLPIKPLEAAPPPGEEDEEMPAPPDRGRQPIPNPPAENERSPFEMDRPGAGGAGAGAPGRGAPQPRGNAPARGAEPSPFETGPGDAGDAGAGANPAARPRGAQAPRTTAPGAPDLAPPGDAPPPPRTSRNEDRGDDRWQDDRGPLLALPDATLPAVVEAAPPRDLTGGSVVESTSPVSTGDGAAATAVATQPAPKRSRLSALFSGLGFNWIRR
jgi:hypothetical protein